MTVIEEKIIRNNGEVFKTSVGRVKQPVKKPEVIDVVKPPVPPLVRAARRSAVVITASIGATSFTLSFAGLSDLAQRSGIPHWLSYLWPLTVDGTIIQATMAIIALAAYESQWRNRRFFWSVLVAAAATSVGGNILHAVLTGPMPPVLAGIIATVAPLSLLATTHGLAVLVRFDPSV